MKSLAHINKYFLKYKWKLLLGIFFIIISNIFGVFIAPLVRLAFDKVKIQLESGTGPLSTEKIDELTSIALIYGLLILASALLKGLFMFFKRQTIIVMSRHIEYDMKNEIFDQYQKLGLNFYRKNKTGDLMSRISEDVGRVRMYIGPAVMYFADLLVTFILVIPMMVYINPELTLYVLAPLPILSFAIYKVNSIINRKSDRIQSQLAKVTSFAQEAFAGIRVLKSFAAENDVLNEFKKETQSYKNKSLSLAKTDALFFPLMMMLIGLSTLLTIFIGGREVINGELTIGNIAEFIIYVNLLTWPVASLGWVTSIVQRAAASQERINEFLNEKPNIISQSNDLFNFNNKLEFKNLDFSYPNSSRKALKNINFEIEKGKTLAILGSTGSGKSTIAALLLRLYDPESGSITYDSKDLKDINLDSYREKIGYVPQDVFLFSDTIEENIAFGLKGELENKSELVKEAAKQAVVYDNIISFPQAFNTLLGERGITLSGGQKQRVAIARAIIKKPEILILDDCLSAVDTKTESEILQNFKSILNDKTAVIISHRVSSVINADTIIVLDDGEIIEKGTHHELLQAGGKYFELYQKQTKEEQGTVFVD